MFKYIVCICRGVSLLEDLAVGSLWESKVHEFVQKLINDHKIVLNALLLQLFEVLCEHLDNTHTHTHTPDGIFIQGGPEERFVFLL